MKPADTGLIEPEELAELVEKDTGSIKLVDASYGNPVYQHLRIDDAVFFDIDDIADKSNRMAHMLPPEDEFATAVSRLGISNKDMIVVYDQSGIAMAAARAWWMFRVFGHDNVHVLNGGLPLWRAQGFPLNNNPPEIPRLTKFKARFRPELVKSMEEVSRIIEKSDTTLIDARSAERFEGQSPESRPGLRQGHIPGSCNLPYVTLIDPASGRLKEPEILKAVFADIGLTTQTTTTCGSGVTACVLALGLYQLGYKDVAVYDGSWTEWGQTSSGMPVQTG
jgi:thiosulfate/3-mercaptopyruvate sulfurtransferase